MGLDITAYKKLAPAPDAQLEDGYPVEWDKFWRPGASMEWSESEFPGRGQGVEHNVTYSFEGAFSFRAGSYSGYNAWRAELAHLVGLSTNAIHAMPTNATGPFMELINFADNEGVIGPIVSAKLLRDFQEHLPKAAAKGGYFFDKYLEWMRALEMAADGGAVDFH